MELDYKKHLQEQFRILGRCAAILETSKHEQTYTHICSMPAGHEGNHECGS